MKKSPYHTQLTQGIEALHLEVPDECIRQLLSYLDLLIKWNKAFNLTAIREPYEMISKHLLDSLSVAPFFANAGSILDVGTGAGFPGVPLAILYPNTDVTLLDANGKKTRFLNHVKADLGLHNVCVEHQRVEQFQSDKRFDLITSRAFAALADMVQGCQHLLAAKGRILAMKGKLSATEIASIGQAAQCNKIIPLQVPGDIGERHLLDLELSDNPH